MEKINFDINKVIKKKDIINALNNIPIKKTKKGKIIDFIFFKLSLSYKNKNFTRKSLDWFLKGITYQELKELIEYCDYKEKNGEKWSYHFWEVIKNNI